MQPVPGMAALMVVASLSCAWAAPAEPPPASWAARQYVDSAGCVFLRDASGGWSARLDRDNRPLCGYEPSVTAGMARLSGPFAAPPPAPPLRLVSALTVPGRLTACPNAPVTAQRYGLSDGRVVMRCGPQVDDPVGFINRAGVAGLRIEGIAPGAGRLPATEAMVEDLKDRLSRPRKAAPPPPAAASVPPARVKPEHAPQARQAQGERFVQVGAFARAGNAERVKARLRALGLPVATGTARIGGREVRVVYAGPFPDAKTADCALEDLRADGFKDAILR